MLVYSFRMIIVNCMSFTLIIVEERKFDVSNVSDRIMCFNNAMWLTISQDMGLSWHIDYIYLLLRSEMHISLDYFDV